MPPLAVVLLTGLLAAASTPVPTPGPLERGEKLLAARQYEKATTQLRKAIEADPTSARAHGDLALALMALQKNREAVDAARLAAAFGPQLPEARYIYGLALAANGRPVEAARELEKAVALKPGEAAPLLALAAAYAAAEDQRAAATYEKLVALRPADVKVRADFADYLWRIDKNAEGNRVAEQAIAAFPSNAELLIRYAQALLLQERALDAAQALEKARTLGSRSALTFALLAAADEQAGNAEAARAVLEAGIETYPNDASLRQNLGRLWLAEGQAAKALPQLEEAARLNPRGVQVLLDLGRALETLGRLDEAEAAYRRAIVLAPNTPRAHYALGRLFQRQGKSAEAQRELEIHHKLYERSREAIAHYDVESAEMAYAWAEWHKGNAGVALARFQALPETPETLRGAALALARLERHAEAVAALERAKALAPDDGRIELLLVTERAQSQVAP